ncbi:MAG TPA: GNAT family N-acetyltransferase [Prolixibacteraceae bacterium]|nr:GNAT family N-acetyltransferase [Prolixibacteraceae bacterium]
MKELKDIVVEVAGEKHLGYVDTINDTIDHAARQRGTGIARRTYEYLAGKMMEGKAIIALEGDNFAGFCYIESWGHHQYVANSGLIVSPEYRGIGLAKEIKKKAFDLSRTRFPDAKIFGLTTGLAVMKINHSLGYRPVTYSELTNDDAFWKGCEGCVNYDILTRMNRSKCLCTGMLYDPAWESEKNGNGSEIKKRSLLDYMRKLNPKNALDLLKKYHHNIRQTKKQQ